MSESRLLYRPAEAAQTLGLSRARLYQLIATGEIGSVKIGASRRIPAVDLEAYVSQLRSGTIDVGERRKTEAAPVTG
jgi:excisionase family DNA binding protein